MDVTVSILVDVTVSILVDVTVSKSMWMDTVTSTWICLARACPPGNSIPKVYKRNADASAQYSDHCNRMPWGPFPITHDLSSLQFSPCGPSSVVYKTTADLDWQRINAREEIGKDFQLFFPTCLMRLFEVTNVVEKLKGAMAREPTAKEVSEAWNSRIQQSSMSEKVSPTYIETVMTIRKRMLSDETVLKMLL